MCCKAKKNRHLNKGSVILSKFKSGFVSVIGQPNVGKSTLMNSLVGEKIAIISNKPQTTRNKIQAILTDETSQIIFIDTPGIHAPKSKLGEYMVKSAESSMRDVDMILYLVNPVEKISPADEGILKKLANTRSPIILVINKIDTVDKEKILRIIDIYKQRIDFFDFVPVSALNGDNTGELLKVIREKLPEGPQYFPADMITDQPERQLVAELVREKALYFLQDEVPHGIAVEVMSMKKRPDKDMFDLEVTIYCEKDSHKGMIIGKNGDMLKKIGQAARLDIERFLGSKMFLQLWVKVKKDWRDSSFLLNSFGYK